MIVNHANMDKLETGFNAAFQRGLGMAVPQWSRVATQVPSTTAQESYDWLGMVPGMREWLGERQVNSLKAHNYSIRNRDFEQTIEVDRNNIEDDQYGVFAPLFEEMGRATAAHPDELVWQAMKDGFSTVCYDGQYFFDTDHPVLDAAGAPQSVANTDGGSGTPWFLIDDSRALKPIIYQVRKQPMFVRKDRPEDDNVFDRRKFRYGVDARTNVGYGFWQFAWGSKQALSATTYAAARAALMGMKGDYGRPLGLMPRLLVVPPVLEEAGRKLLNSEYASGGETNPWKGTAELLVVPWLA